MRREILLYVINSPRLTRERKRKHSSFSLSLSLAFVADNCRRERDGRNDAILGGSTVFGWSSLRDTRGIIKRLRRFFISFLIRIVKFTAPGRPRRRDSRGRIEFTLPHPCN
jgi:hypothetical protein